MVTKARKNETTKQNPGHFEVDLGPVLGDRFKQAAESLGVAPEKLAFRLLRNFDSCLAVARQSRADAPQELHGPGDYSGIFDRAYAAGCTNLVRMLANVASIDGPTDLELTGAEVVA